MLVIEKNTTKSYQTEKGLGSAVWFTTCQWSQNTVHILDIDGEWQRAQ